MKIKASYGLLYSLLKFFTSSEDLYASSIFLGRLCVLVQNRAIYIYLTYQDNIIR